MQLTPPSHSLIPRKCQAYNCYYLIITQMEPGERKPAMWLANIQELSSSWMLCTYQLKLEWLKKFISLYFFSFSKVHNSSNDFKTGHSLGINGQQMLMALGCALSHLLYSSLLVISPCEMTSYRLINLTMNLIQILCKQKVFSYSPSKKLKCKILYRLRFLKLT